MAFSDPHVAGMQPLRGFAAMVNAGHRHRAIAVVFHLADIQPALIPALHHHQQHRHSRNDQKHHDCTETKGTGSRLWRRLILQNRQNRHRKTRTDFLFIRFPPSIVFLLSQNPVRIQLEIILFPGFLPKLQNDKPAGRKTEKISGKAGGTAVLESDGYPRGGSDSAADRTASGQNG